MTYKIQFTNLSTGHNGWIRVMRAHWPIQYGAKRDAKDAICLDNINCAYQMHQELSDDKNNSNYRYEVIKTE